MYQLLVYHPGDGVARATIKVHSAANVLDLIPQLLAEQFGMSRSEARRNIAQGGVRLDGDPVTDLDIAASDLAGRVLQVGKRRFLKLQAA